MEKKKKLVSKNQETNLMVKVSCELKQKVHEKARLNDLTMSQLIRRLLTDYVNEPQGKLNF